MQNCPESHHELHLAAIPLASQFFDKQSYRYFGVRKYVLLFQKPTNSYILVRRVYPTPNRIAVRPPNSQVKDIGGLRL